MFKTKLVLAFATLLLMLLMLAGSLYWGVNQANRFVERSNLAHEELETYLSLSAETYRMFKQFRRILLDEGIQAADEVDEYRSRLGARIEDLREKIESEATLISSAPSRDANRIEELGRLTALTDEISQALDNVAEAQQLFDSGRRAEAEAFLSSVLVNRIDGRVGILIDEAVAEERSQVIEAKQAARRVSGQLATFAEVAAIAGVLLVIAAITILLRGLTRPLDALTHGTRVLAGGDLSHRINIPGYGEFAQLAACFNDMALDLEVQRRQLQEAQRGLEHKVEKRTEELRRANETLKQTDRIRRSFFAEISHELRTPLTIIRGEGEVSLYGGKMAADDYRISIRRMVEQAEHLGTLVGDLFLIARSSAGVADLRAKEVSLSALTLEVCGDAGVLGSPKHIDIKLTASEPADGEIVVMGDRRRLRQLILILLDNAIRYSPDYGSITVGLQELAEIIELKVSDQGPGIPEDDLAHVLDRYYRGDQGRRLSPEGSGLGLPLAKSIAEAHGGKIAVDSVEGNGTTVIVRLPVLSTDNEPDNAKVEVAS